MRRTYLSLENVIQAAWYREISKCPVWLDSWANLISKGTDEFNILMGDFKKKSEKNYVVDNTGVSC